MVVVFDAGQPVTILNINDRYNDVKFLLEQGRYSEVPEAVDKALSLRRTTRGKFTVQNGAIVIDGTVLPKALSERLMALVDCGEDTERLENFWDNLAQNPTESARQDLYEFLVANNVPITRDGCFIVYKKVRDNYWDSYSGDTFLCEPGAIIEMAREDVDHNRQNTCSAGLHVAAWEYASGFSGTRTMECKVNPRDVVAVPPDYSQQKMRCCRAEILRQATEKYVERTYDSDTNDGRLIEDIGTVVIEPDGEGRVRIPGKLIRKLGVGVGYQVEVVLEDDGDDFLFLRAVEDASDCDDDAWAVYTVRDDNSIRVSASTLDWAGLAGYVIEVGTSGECLTLRAAVE
jgi:antitoxin component of MazEF toxin-antitoxin module